MDRWSFKLENQDGSPVYATTHNNQPLKLLPEEVSAQVLIEIAGRVKEWLRIEKNVTLNVVLTVPAYFSTNARNKTI